VVPLGTRVDIYPASKVDAGIFDSNGTINPSTSEYKSNGPESPPGGITIVTNIVIL